MRKLRKPTAAAWVVNQLSRRNPDRIEALIEAGTELRRLESELLEGRAEAETMRVAARRERELADALVEEARVLLSEPGGKVSGDVVDRVSETLQAAAVDPEVEADVRRGTLAREQRAASLGALAAGPQQRKRSPTRASRPRKRSAEARRDELAATRRAERAGSARERASVRLERAREAVREREWELEEAERELQQARDALEQAKRRG